MRFEDGERSENAEDRRGMPGGRGMVGGGIGTIILVIVGLYFGVDPSVILQIVSGNGPPAQIQQQPRPAGKDPMVDFVSAVLADTEKTWDGIFRQHRKTYEDPKLVLFTRAVNSACGTASSAMSPFYCPEDHKVYIDLSFYEDLKNRFKAPGDFAQAYVIAHEVGHHVQNQPGITSKVQSAMQRSDKVQANHLSVGTIGTASRLLASVWGYNAEIYRHILKAGDLEEALQAASAIGDDRLLKQAHGVVVPDAFTHGTSEQRVRWFKRGFETGDMKQCETSKTDPL